jgi:hypothetical protein
LHEVELGVDEEGERISSCVVAADDFSPSQAKPLTQNARQAIAAYKTVAIRTAEAAVRGVPLRNWRDEFFRISTANSPEGKKKAFTRARDALQEIAALVVDGDYNRITLPDVVVAVTGASEAIGKAFAEADLLARLDDAGHGTFAEHCRDVSQGLVGRTGTPP